MGSLVSKSLEQLKKALLSLAAQAEEQTQDALRALLDNDIELARRVIEKDGQLDEFEVEIEEDCLKCLALYQPVAFDLRFIIAVLKINNDLERIGDLAVNLASRCIKLQELPREKYPFDVQPMGQQSLEMLSLSIDSLIKQDTGLARQVIERDQAVDDLHRAHFTRVNEAISQDARYAEYFIQFLSISRYLERTADLATNIAEDVIYLIDGTIIRHRSEEDGA